MDALEALTTTRAHAPAEARPGSRGADQEGASTRRPARRAPATAQGWDFVVVRDPAQRKKIGDLIRETVLPRLVPIPESGGVDGSRAR